MSDYSDLFWKNYNGELTESEKVTFGEMTTQLRQDNPTRIGGYLVHTSESCDSCDFNERYEVYATRGEAQKAVADWKGKPSYDVQVPGVYGSQSVGHYAFLQPVTEAAFQRGGPWNAPLSCTINGEVAHCVEFEDGLSISLPDYSAQHAAAKAKKLTGIKP